MKRGAGVTHNEHEHSVPVNDSFADFDFGSLDFNSDFKRFMSETVPDGVRNRALQILWLSNDIIGCPDELDDYLEDFSEDAMALPAELAKSAYQIGAGFVGDDEADASVQALEQPGKKPDGKIAMREAHRSPAGTLSELSAPLTEEGRAEKPEDEIE